MKRTPLVRRTPLRTKTPLKARIRLKVAQKPKKKPIKLGALKKRFWAIFSEYIRRRDADSEGMNTCVTCGARLHWKLLQGGHYVRKSAGLSLYFDEQNVWPQCFADNIWRDGATDEYALFLVKKFGAGILEELNRRKHLIKKYTPQDYERLIQQYREKLDRLQTSF